MDVSFIYKCTNSTEREIYYLLTTEMKESESSLSINNTDNAKHSHCTSYCQQLSGNVAYENAYFTRKIAGQSTVMSEKDGLSELSITFQNSSKFEKVLLSDFIVRSTSAFG